MNPNRSALPGRPWALVIALVALAACTSVPAPQQEMAAAARAVQAAAGSGAAIFAPGELSQARRKLEQAQAALRAQEHERARRLAEQALVDAELAAAKAGTKKVKRRAAALRDSIRDLGPPDVPPAES